MHVKPKPFEVCFVTRNYCKPIPEGHTNASLNIVRSAIGVGVKANILSIETSRSIERTPQFTNCIKAPAWSGGSNFFIFLSTLPKVLTSLRSIGNKSAVIHFLNVPFPLIAMIARFVQVEATLVAHVYYPPHEAHPLLRDARSFFINWSIDHFLCINNYLMSYFHDFLNIQHSRLFPVPYSIDTEKFQPATARRDIRHKYGLPISHPIVAYVGQILPERGVFVLLHAFKKLLQTFPHAKLLICTPNLPPERKFRQDLQKSIKILGNKRNTIMLGRLKRVQDIYNLADVITFPFIKAHSIIDPPVSILEAMSSGSVIIASKVGAIKEVISHMKNGLLAEPNDPKALAGLMVDVLDNQDTYRELGMVARDTVVSRYSLENVGNLLLQFYSSIIYE